MRLPLLALVMIVLAAATSFAAPTVPRPRGAAAAAAPARAPRGRPAAQHKNVKKTFDAEPRVVSWTYDKLHHPHVVAAALRDVAAGKMSRSEVASLASPETLDALIDANLTAGEPVRRGPTIGAAPKGQTRKQSAAAVQSEWAKITPMLSAEPEYWPKQLQLPDAYDKETKRASVWFTANTDGFVTATLPTGAPFRIKRIVSYDGSYTMSPLGPLMTPWDSRNAPPFALSVRAGQQFAVTVEFAPEFKIGKMMAGAKSGKLRVKGGSFTVDVPITGMFNGIRTAGVVLRSNEDQVVIDTPSVGLRTTVTTKMEVLNLGNDPRTATISAESLPTGITLVGSPSVSLGVGESKSVDVTLQLENGEYGYGQPLVLRATAPGGLTSSTAMTVNVVKTYREWLFNDSVEGVDLALVYRLDSSGNWFFSGTQHNTGSILGWHIEMQLILGDDYVPNWPFRSSPGTMTGIGGPALVAQSSAWKDTGPDGKGTWSKAFFADLISRSAHFEIELDSVP